MMKELLENTRSALDGDPAVEAYFARHGIEAANILTVGDDEQAALIAEHLRPRIEGKVVVEIGGGIGLLGCHLAQVARRVFVIEADPMWSSVFVVALYRRKPKNLTYILGAADELAGILRADVALFCAHSATESLRRAGALFADEVIDVYGELVPEAARLRELKAR